MQKLFSVFSASKPTPIENRTRTPLNSLWRFAPIGSEWVILATSLFFSVFSNQAFWLAVLSGRNWANSGTWLFAVATFFILTALHNVLLSLVVNRWTVKFVIVILLVVNAMAVYYMQHYTVFFDPGMVRNVLHTDVKEARELLSFNLAIQILVAGVLPSLFIICIRLKDRPLRRSIFLRTGFLFANVLVIAGCLAVTFQDIAATMRNQKEIRYLITPSNYLTSLARALTADTNQARQARVPVGTDAALAASWAKRSKPVVFVIVVGETARASNWGLNGYVRQTTPKLAAADDVLNYPQVSSCGTNTEVSLPCMFSPFGRKNYDEKKIRQHESLLHVLEHSGIKTIWRDNQSGCKGVCDGLEQQQLDNYRHPSLCDGERCLDEILLENLDTEIQRVKGNLVIVLHQLGNHGPAYYRRYPAPFQRFTPTCETADFGKCTQQEIVNSYDNALLYTDYLLDKTIQKLKAQQTHDAAMLYVSDHGESLGENNFYLHGLPYAIAPKEQTRVPMVLWLSNGFVSSFGLDQTCLKAQATQPISHDHLFHSVLGLLQVNTQVYDKNYDISTSCRASGA